MDVQYTGNLKQPHPRRIAVFGLGYVGCVTAACLAEIGHDVTGVDPDVHKLRSVNEGHAPFAEPDLGELVSANVAAGRLRASDARLARLALTMLARAGPDGRPEIAASFTIQDGQMYLGPAKLGPAPRINWQ